MISIHHLWAWFKANTLQPSTDSLLRPTEPRLGWPITPLPTQVEAVATASPTQRRLTGTQMALPSSGQLLPLTRILQVLAVSEPVQIMFLEVPFVFGWPKEYIQLLALGGFGMEL
jgi:hypothetical protein